MSVYIEFHYGPMRLIEGRGEPVSAPVNIYRDTIVSIPGASMTVVASFPGSLPAPDQGPTSGIAVISTRSADIRVYVGPTYTNIASETRYSFMFAGTQRSFGVQSGYLVALRLN